MATSKIASWSTSLSPTSIPPTTQHAALRSLYNYLGCTLHGASHSTVRRALSALTVLLPERSRISSDGPDVDTHSGPTLLGTSHELDAEHAALLNGIASHVHDYDDTHLATIIHPTGPVASALLAYVQHTSNLPAAQTLSGAALLTALTAGIEVACKLGLAVWPRHYDTGWHITSTTGSIGAAVAVSKLMGLSQTQVEHAVGIAATQVTGLRCNFGSDTKSFHVGRAAQNGLLAAALASKGFTSSEASLDAKRGWANVVVGGRAEEVQLDRYIKEELGKVWEIERNSFKPFPCGIVAHPGIDAAVRLREQISHTVGHDETKLKEKLADLRFEVKVHPLVVELTSKRTPKDGLEAKFSVFHGIAVGLLYGKAGPAQYGDDVVKDPDVMRIRDAVQAEADGQVESDATILTAHSKGDVGPAFKVHVEHAVGSLHVPMTDEQLTKKFVDQVALNLGDEGAMRLSDLCWKIGDTHDVGWILARLSTIV